MGVYLMYGLGYIAVAITLIVIAYYFRKEIDVPGSGIVLFALIWPVTIVYLIYEGCLDMFSIAVDFLDEIFAKD